MKYAIGDSITFRDAGSTKTHNITVIQRWVDRIDNYVIPGFVGKDQSGRLRWGHDYQVLLVSPATNGRK